MPTMFSMSVPLTAAADAGADGDGFTTPLAGAAVTIVVAVVGWLLYAWYRRRDHRRADLTETAQTLRRVDLEVRRLRTLRCALTSADLTTLGDLLLHVQRAAARSGQGRRLRPLQAALTRVADVIVRLFATASASSDDVAQAHLRQSSLADVPVELSLARLVSAVREQERTAGDLAAAVRCAEERVEGLRTA
ncbi:hypothetical protein ACIF85_47345 [Streptomyces sp. NPDC086033]|uniref:hypothetical protein n=1 Tax=Streptomyces sp. NPDC086033 TaxID=3365747 RepID=UPI0037CFAAB9